MSEEVKKKTVRKKKVSNDKKPVIKEEAVEKIEPIVEETITKEETIEQVKEELSEAEKTISQSKEEIRYCSKCGERLKEGALFCHRCGTSVIAKKPICANCGYELENDDAYCPACGHKVGPDFEDKAVDLLNRSENWFKTTWSKIVAFTKKTWQQFLKLPMVTKLIIGTIVIALLLIIVVSGIATGGKSIKGTYSEDFGYYSITFQENKTYTVSMFGMTTANGSYKVKGNKIILTDSEGNDYIGEIISDNTIEIESGGMVLTLYLEE